MDHKFHVSFGFLCLFIFFLTAHTGCAPTLPPSVSISEEEKDNVYRKFTEMVNGGDVCNCCLDAMAKVKLKSFLHSGTMNGFVQALNPSYLKFVGLNPLGQIMAVLATDGKQFSYVSVPEAKGWEGKVESATFRKYAPKGLLPEYAFYWLIGRIPKNELEIKNISKDAANNGYWLELESTSTRSQVLFNIENGIIIQHLLLGSDGKIVLNIAYSDYDGSTQCPLPGLISVTSNNKNTTMEIQLEDWLTDSVFSVSEFNITIPPQYEKVLVQ